MWSQVLTPPLILSYRKTASHVFTSVCLAVLRAVLPSERYRYSSEVNYLIRIIDRVLRTALMATPIRRSVAAAPFFLDR